MTVPAHGINVCADAPRQLAGRTVGPRHSVVHAEAKRHTGLLLCGRLHTSIPVFGDEDTNHVTRAPPRPMPSSVRTAKKVSAGQKIVWGVYATAGRVLLCFLSGDCLARAARWWSGTLPRNGPFSGLMGVGRVLFPALEALTGYRSLSDTK
jgi:hypothetical protein